MEQKKFEEYLQEAIQSYESKVFEEYLHKKIDLQFFASAEEEGRTEKPSEHKLRKAREEGRVPKSQEISGALVLLLPVVCIICLAPWIFKNCIEIIDFYISRSCSIEITDPSVYGAFYYYFLKITLPIFGVAIVAGVCGNILQTRGMVVSAKAIAPKFNKLIPKFGEYFKRTLFSIGGVFNLLKSIIKVSIIFVIAYIIIKNNINQLLTLLETNLWIGITFVAKLVAKLLVISACVFLVVSVPDYFVQRYQFMESMKMTKQEVKEEYKELEGDPYTKGRLKQYMHEMMTRNLVANVSKADVVITNPTHYAVALQYDKEIAQAPMVVAKGVDNIALKIREIAKENDIPMKENRPLARELYDSVEVGDIVPEKYYVVLSVILAEVYNMKAKHGII